MKRFDESNVLEKMTKFVRAGVHLLSTNDFEVACSWLDRPQSPDKDITWNTDKLRDVFPDYCWYERVPVIASPYQMDLKGEKISFCAYDDGSGYGVEYEIPLDGEWVGLGRAVDRCSNPRGFVYGEKPVICRAL